MNFRSFLRGLSRAFTVPRAIRNKVDHSMIGQLGKEALLSELNTVVGQTIDKHVTNADENAAVKAEIGNVLQVTGIAPKQ